MRQPACRLSSPTRSSIFAASLGALTAALIGCSGGRFSTDAPPPINTEAAFGELGINAESANQLGYELDWRGAPFLSKGKEIRFVREYNDLVTVLDTAGNLSFLDAQTGGYRGNRPIATPSSQFFSLFRIGPTVFVTTESEIFGVNVSSQDLVVRQRLAHIVTTGPAFIGTTLVFGTSSGAIRTHNLQASTTLWSNGTDYPVLRDPIVVGENTVVALSESGEILTMSPTDGATIGRAKIFNGPGGAPITGDGLLFIASKDQSLYCFVPGQREPIWRVRTQSPLEFAPTYHEAALYCTVPGLGMTKYDALTGDVVWTQSEVEGTVVAKRRNTVLVWNTGGVTVVDAEYGDVIRHVPLPGTREIYATDLADSPLIVIGRSGALARLIPQF